jgi:hypothetical protein
VEAERRNDGAKQLGTAKPEEGNQVGAAPDGVRLEVRSLSPRLEDRIIFGARRPAARGYFFA